MWLVVQGPRNRPRRGQGGAGAAAMTRSPRWWRSCQLPCLELFCERGLKKRELATGVPQHASHASFGWHRRCTSTPVITSTLYTAAKHVSEGWTAFSGLVEETFEAARLRDIRSRRPLIFKALRSVQGVPQSCRASRGGAAPGSRERNSDANGRRVNTAGREFHSRCASGPRLRLRRLAGPPGAAQSRSAQPPPPCQRLWCSHPSSSSWPSAMGFAACPWWRRTLHRASRWVLSLEARGARGEGRGLRVRLCCQLPCTPASSPLHLAASCPRHVLRALLPPC